MKEPRRFPAVLSGVMLFLMGTYLFCSVVVYLSVKILFRSPFLWRGCDVLPDLRRGCSDGGDRES